MYRNGVPFGTCWRVVRGGGCVVGRVDEDGRLSGGVIIVLYSGLLQIKDFYDFIFCRYEHRLHVPRLPDSTGGNLPERGDGVRPGRPAHRRHQRGRLYHAPALQAATVNIEWQKS